MAKVNVTTAGNLSQKEYWGVSASMTEEGELCICEEDGVIIKSYEKGEWTAFAVEADPED